MSEWHTELLPALGLLLCNSPCAVWTRKRAWPPLLLQIIWLIYEKNKSQTFPNSLRSPVWRTAALRVNPPDKCHFSLLSFNVSTSSIWDLPHLQLAGGLDTKPYSMSQITADWRKTCIFTENDPSSRRSCVFEISFVAPAVVKLTQHVDDQEKQCNEVVF